MLSDTKSLMEAEEAAPKQLELVPSTELPAAFFEDGENGTRGEFTAARLFSAHPDKYRAIVSLTAEGVSARLIARSLKVSHNTVKAVLEREGVALSREREAVAQDYKFLERLIIERLVDGIDQIKLEALPMALGILRDKINVLEGTPTSINLNISAEAPISKINDFIDALPRVSGEVLENGDEEAAPHTGLSEGNVSAIGEAEAAGDQAGSGLEGGAND